MTQEPGQQYDASVIGVEVESGSFEVSEDHVLAYCRAVGETNPLYTNTAAASAGPHGCLIAPPAFVTALPSRAGLDARVTYGNSSFNAGQHCDFRLPVKVGDVLTAYSAVHEIYEKTGRSGRMLFVVRRLTYRNQRDEVVAVVDSSMVHRSIERG